MTTFDMNIKHFKSDYGFRLEKKTLYLYGKAVEQVLAFCSKPIQEITTKDVRNWLIYLHSKGYQPATVYWNLAGIKLFFRYCLEESLISEDPTVSIPLPTMEETLPRYLQEKQVTQLRQIVEGKVRERALIEVLYTTGVRISELVAMKKEDIDWSERLIYIPKGKRKKERIVLFTKECEEHLKAYLEKRNDELPFVFVNRYGTRSICIRTIQKLFKTIEKELGIPLTPHTLRHSFAANLARRGMPLEGIQVLLGHESPQQTHLYAKLYDHARKQMYDEWM